MTVEEAGWKILETVLSLPHIHLPDRIFTRGQARPVQYNIPICTPWLHLGCTNAVMSDSRQPGSPSLLPYHMVSYPVDHGEKPSVLEWRFNLE